MCKIYRIYCRECKTDLINLNTSGLDIEEVASNGQDERVKKVLEEVFIERCGGPKQGRYCPDIIRDIQPRKTFEDFEKALDPESGEFYIHLLPTKVPLACKCEKAIFEERRKRNSDRLDKDRYASRFDAEHILG